MHFPVWVLFYEYTYVEIISLLDCIIVPELPMLLFNGKWQQYILRLDGNCYIEAQWRNYPVIIGTHHINAYWLHWEIRIYPSPMMDGYCAYVHRVDGRILYNLYVHRVRVRSLHVQFKLRDSG